MRVSQSVLHTDCGDLVQSSGTSLGHVVTPGIYAGRIGDRVKIGYSLNLPQRVDQFRFEELIAVLPFGCPQGAGESEGAYVVRVRYELRARERQIHTALDSYRLRGLTRSNANEWFRLDDVVLSVLADYGAIIARARPAGRSLRCRVGRLRPAVLAAPEPPSTELEETIARLSRLAGLRG